MTPNMTCQDHMSQVMNKTSSKFVGKSFLLFPKCESKHWSLYETFNVNGEDKYEESSILYFDSKKRKQIKFL